MRFVCDSCRAQYMISDDKVGAKGVKVRCKKCGYNIVVRPAGSGPGKEEGPSGEAADSAATSQASSKNDGLGLPAVLGTPPEGGIFGGVEDDEIGAVFDQVLNSGSHKIPAVAPASESPAQVDAAVVSDAGEAVRKLVEAEAGSAKSAAAHEWFVAIDDKQVGPLSMDKVKDYWDRGEVGPDSLCWRAGFSDWIPLSEASELASVLAPRPTRPVIVAPASMEPSAPVASAPVESAFSAGGKAGKAEAPMNSGASSAQESSGWKPSAASVLASLVKEENEALSKPAPKAAPVEERAMPAASGLLDVPPPEPAPAAARSPLLAEPPAPAAPYLAPPQAHAPQPAQAYAPPPPAAYPGYPPQAASAPKQGSKMGLIIGVAAGVLLLGGGAGFYFATKPSEQPGPVTPPAATQQAVAQVPTETPPKPAELPPMPPPPAGTTQDAQGTPAAGATAQPAAATATPPPSTAPAVAAAGTPTTAPAANPPAPTTPPPAEQAKPAEPPKTEQQVARAEVPDRSGTRRGTSRPTPTSRDSSEDESKATASRGGSKPQPSSGNADDEFDELFGTKKSGKTESASGGRTTPTAYIPPEPGSGGAALERLGQSDIMQVVLANKPAIVKCVNEQKKKEPGLSGKLVMRWTIQTNGKTKNVSCQTSEFRSTYMASCISGLIKGWTFPKHKVQGEPIDFPFTF